MPEHPADETPRHAADAPAGNPHLAAEPRRRRRAPGPLTRLTAGLGRRRGEDRDATGLMDGTHDEYAVLARGLGVTAAEGRVYGPIDVAVPATGVTVLSGRGGSGRTALALTIAGRMRPTEGRLMVLGETRRAAIRRRVAIAGVDQIDLLDRDLRVGRVLTEHRYWSQPVWRPARTVDEDYLADLAGELYGSRTLPPLDAYVSQLPGLDRHLLRIAMALNPAHGGEIGLLIVDDLEQVHELDERIILLTRLVELSHRIPVVINAVNPLPHALVPPQRQVRLDTDASHITPFDWGIGDAELDEMVKEYAE
ncbi:ATP-binding cassette domain-containing protein [Corynebacterium sphenisci]|uniref:ATP-binding cassette domain-containing protein n=1 Tax=Corynebacterium sphenisci TaxID=191493 RepID=UPI0026E027AF|nr:ATP-binding cassette domain-containing protein [Corynebacterium sphenisci]MDO5731588.1 ABC transporter ATP-binding protein [Corynebacterium sphenisci]